MKTWFQKPRISNSNVPKTLFDLDLKPKIIDILVLIHRLRGEEEALNFVEQFFFLVQVIYVDEQYIDWAQLVSEILSSPLHSAKVFNSS